MPKKPKKPDAEKQVNAVPERTGAQSRIALKRKVRIFYDLQRLRIQTAGRGQKKAPESPILLHPYDVELLDRRAAELAAAEATALKDVADHLATLPFYRDVLSDKTRYKGIGPTMAGVILSEFDIAREDTASKMWAFAGLAPVPARRCKACNEVLVPPSAELLEVLGIYRHRKTTKCPQGLEVRAEHTYESGKTMRPEKGEKLPYNAWLRMKLVGVLAPVLLKVGSPWKKVYDDYKHRKTSAGWGTSDGHRHQAAMRYMIKMLLLDIWREWRAHEGLPVRPSYQEEKLGHAHKATSAPATDAPVDVDEDPEVAAELERLEASP